MSERLLTAREVADYLRLTPRAVMARFNAGKLPGFRLDDGRGPVRFRLSEIDAWLEGRRQGAAA